MLHVSANIVEIYFGKIGFVNSKWSNLNAPGSGIYSTCQKVVPSSDSPCNAGAKLAQRWPKSVDGTTFSHNLSWLGGAKYQMLLRNL